MCNCLFVISIVYSENISSVYSEKKKRSTHYVSNINISIVLFILTVVGSIEVCGNIFVGWHVLATFEEERGISGHSAIIQSKVVSIVINTI